MFLKGTVANKQVPPLKTVIPQSGLNMITQLCYMINSVYPQPQEDTRDPEEEVDAELIEAIFIYCIYNSVGAALVADCRFDFDEFVKSQCSLLKQDDTVENKADSRHLPCSFPTLYDYYFDVQEQVWIAWKWIVPEYEHDSTKRFSEILVPNS
jgi:dynein heavy chain